MGTQEDEEVTGRSAESMARALEVEVLPQRPESPPAFGAVTPAASLAARHATEDQGLSVRDPGYYAEDVHTLRRRMREQHTIEDFDFELALITKSIEQLLVDVKEIREATSRSDVLLPEKWMERLTRGYVELQRELTKRIDVKTQMTTRREKLRMSRRYLVESELIVRWGRKVDAAIERLVRSGLDTMLRLAPGSLREANTWAADALERASMDLENIPAEIAREMAPGRAAAEAARAANGGG